MDFSTIFKAYDVRGIFPAELDGVAAQRIGAAFARFAAAPRLAVGRDCRTSSPELFAALVAGVTSQGVDVVDIGLITTDMLYFVSGKEHLPGVVITASHNPAEYNGLKFCREGAAPVGAESGLLEIQAGAEKGVDPVGRTGSVTRLDAVPGYVDHVLGIVGPDAIHGLRVAADGGNGMAGVALPQVFDRIDASLDALYLDPDGTFPNHPADPLRPENLVDLLALVDRAGADIGVAFDGDADRAFFVDERGRALPGSTTTAILAEWFLQRNAGAVIVHNLICSKAVPETVVRAGGVPIRTRVGHSFIKQVMKDSGAVFGGEHSGHYYFRDNYRADSGILAMLILLRVMSERGIPLSEIRKDYEPYFASGEINMQVDEPAAALERVAAAFVDEPSDRLDGLTVDLPGGVWFNLRPSNTEPVLRLNAEAPHEDTVSRLVGRVRDVLGVQP